MVNLVMQLLTWIQIWIQLPLTWFDDFINPSLLHDTQACFGFWDYQIKDFIWMTL